MIKNINVQELVTNCSIPQLIYIYKITCKQGKKIVRTFFFLKS